MKKYLAPEIETLEITEEDVITTSLGTETGIVDEEDGIWN